MKTEIPTKNLEELHSARAVQRWTSLPQRTVGCLSSQQKLKHACIARHVLAVDFPQQLCCRLEKPFKIYKYMIL